MGICLQCIGALSSVSHFRARASWNSDGQRWTLIITYHFKYRYKTRRLVSVKAALPCAVVGGCCLDNEDNNVTEKPFCQPKQFTLFLCARHERSSVQSVLVQ